jgi:hypothetical protein
MAVFTKNFMKISILVPKLERNTGNCMEAYTPPTKHTHIIWFLKPTFPFLTMEISVKIADTSLNCVENLMCVCVCV